jgi:hypothetical protein
LKPRPDSSATHACTSGCRIAATGTAPKRGKMYELKYASSRDTADGLQVVSDERVNQLTGKEREAANRVPTGSALKLKRRAQLTRALRRARNRPGGYWVAAADPGAASQAVTDTVPGRSLRRAALLSDGASRLVDPFGLATWEELLELLEESGPDELVRQVRAAEAVDPEGRQWPRTKHSDDATAVYLVVNRAIGIQS